ncbi:uncharacterized protein LOC126567280 [Anopheles maculipalpis]|uniref:uncharacterized protein LOC126567280 n=1 Tax=Anopheles maculipalpis TaxID=1496333 RepID=UPI0021594C6A|nr:uncharacterized protein LOC126567280 [Anopheles maculipalpis]
MMSYRHSIASTASEEGSCDVNNNNMLSADNLLRLALKKPKSWKWELTTSSSSPNISFPKIQLFDGVSGELMVEVDRPDCVIRSDCTDVGRGSAEQPVLMQSSSSSREAESRQGRYRRSRTSLVKEKLSTSGDSLADIFNQLQNKGLGHKLSTSGSQYKLLNGDVEEEEGRGSSLQKSKSANAIGTQEAPPIVRRRSRRSLASRSSSILERISEFYGRSSTEEEDARDLQLVLPPVPQLALPANDSPAQPPLPDGVTIEEIPADPSTTPIKARPKIYKLVRSHIGTLMVREESFHTQRSLRRRQRENGELAPSAQDSERLVELDEWTDRPRPADTGEVERFRYEREINRIDGLLSRVMLSHDLQTEEEHREAPSIRITEPPDVVESLDGCTAHQNGTSHRKRRTRRSVSVGGSIHSPHRRSISSQANGHRSASSSSTSDMEQDTSRRDQRTGSSSRSGSQKRRGRTRHRTNAPDSSARAAISNGDQLVSRTGEPERPPVAERSESSVQRDNSDAARIESKPPEPTAPTVFSNDRRAEERPLVGNRTEVRTKPKQNSNGSSTVTVSSFLADSYNTSDKVIQKLVQSLGRSLNACKRDRLEAKRKGSSFWLRHVPGCCCGSAKSVSPPVRDSIISETDSCLRFRNARNRLPPSVCTESLLDRTTPITDRKGTDEEEDDDEDEADGGYVRRDYYGSVYCSNGSTHGGRFVHDRQLLEFPEVEPTVELTCAYQQQRNHPGDDDKYEENYNEHEYDETGDQTCALHRSASERHDRNRYIRSNMGANVSSAGRQNAKGLTSGRRAQSIDNLKSDTTQYFHQYNNNNHGDTFHHQTFLADSAGSNADGGGEDLEKQPPPPDLACLPGTGQLLHTDQQDLQQLQDQVIYVSRKDRNKFCGSLPNHLDLDASTIDRDCEAIVKQNEFLQANLKNVQQHQQQQQQQTASRTLYSQPGGENPPPPNGSHAPHQQLTFGGSVPVPDHPSVASLQHLHAQLPTYQQQQHHGSPLLRSNPATIGTTNAVPGTVGSGAVGGDGVGNSTFRSSDANVSGQQQHQATATIPNLQLKLPLHRTAIDAGCDQGYGSERSPEDDLPPPLLLMHETQYIEILASSSTSSICATAAPCQQPPVEQQAEQQQPCWTHGTDQVVVGPYSFITKDSIFFVQVSKGSRGLGFSVSGGSDSSAPYPGLIRIKRLFPHQAAWATGMLQPGDILLEANGVPLTGLTNYLALEILRKATNVVTLTVCRPKDEQYRKLSPPTEPPRPPLRNALSYDQGHGSNSVPQSPLPVAIPFKQQQQQQQQIHHFFPPQNSRNSQLPSMAGFLPSLDPIQTNFNGEFEIVLTKQQGSLGFTLRKEDESVLGHYVRALVREPALSDGRIQPGDKIVAVNDVPVSSMTHEEAVIFLRQAADVVRLRLYRDQAQTPLSAHSPSEPSIRDRTRLFLRPEAINLLSELAASRFHRAAAGSGSSVTSSHTNSPRRLRRAGAHQAGFDNNGFHQQHSNDTFNYSDSCSNASTIVSQAVDDLEESYYCDEEIDAIVASEDNQSNGEEHGPRPRPTFLDLDAGARFQLTGTGATIQQLNNLDRDTLNAPLRYGLEGPGTPGMTGPDPDGPNFVSLPCETFLVACKTEQDLQTSGDQTEAIYVQHFAHKSPLYSSVNIPSRVGAAELVEAVERGGKKSLMKWKGATLLGDEEEVQGEATKAAEQGATEQQQQDSLITPEAEDSSAAATAGTTLSTATPTTERELFDLNASCGTDSEGNQIFTVELNKGWNSRLGFSLKQDNGPNGSTRTVISAIYRDSVAARDGRLRVGDVLIMVNEDSVEAVPTAQVIELMRIVRGSIFITLMRPFGGVGSAESTLEPTPEEPVEPSNPGTITSVHSDERTDADSKESVTSTTTVAKQEKATSEACDFAEASAERQ